MAIPLNSIHKEPSAELDFNQRDQDSLPDYKVLDEILINTEDLKFVILFGEVSCNLAFNCESIISPSINQLMHKQSLKKELWETIKNKLNI